MIENKENSDAIRYTTAWKLPTLIGDKKIKISKDLADRAIKIALDKNINNYIRREILEVAYYHDEVDKNYVIKLMQKVYNNSINKFIKERAVDILHGLGKSEYKNLIITSDEWDKNLDNINALLLF